MKNEQTNYPPSIAHKMAGDMNWVGIQHFPGGMVPWLPAQAPDWHEGGQRTDGRLCSCGYCGSMHPAEVAAAIRAGARGHWADFKYGWPHKFYLEGVPNPHAGMVELTSSIGGEPRTDEDRAEYSIKVPSGRFDERTGQPTFYYYAPGKPAPALSSHEKFYTVHLLDATAEDREVIERAMGLSFTFHADGRVSWTRFEERTPEQPAN